MTPKFVFVCACGQTILCSECLDSTDAACPSCGARARMEEVARLLPPSSALGLRQTIVLAAAAALTLLWSMLTYSARVPHFQKVFQDLGRSLPRISNLIMYDVFVYAACVGGLLGCVCIVLFAWTLRKWGKPISLWPARICFLMLVAVAIWNATVDEALFLPLRDLVENPW